MGKYKAIVFDCDGTVLNTVDDLADSVNHILAEFNYPTRSIPEIKSFLGNGLRVLIEKAVPQELTKVQVDEVFTVFKPYYIANCQVKTKPYAGIMDVLKELKEKGYKLAIVSNKNEAALKELNEQFFAGIWESEVGEHDGMTKKPAPDMVEKALQDLNCTKDEAIYIGDSEVDKATADNSKLDCMLVSWGFRARTQLEELKPLYLVDTTEEILKVLV